MASFGVCYLGVDGVSVVRTTVVETDDLAEALIATRLDLTRPARHRYREIQIWTGGRLVFCGDPDKSEHRAAPVARCSTRVRELAFA